MKKLFARIAAWVRAILRGRNKDQVVGAGGGGDSAIAQRVDTVESQYVSTNARITSVDTAVSGPPRVRIDPDGITIFGDVRIDDRRGTSELPTVVRIS
ncbi:hypothetical protein [uncultured Sphingomonas sp.]|uniref:hypothetical protein n=1 Tax=uncultured Sphingomonas sp. TaxID=158754 RepID=UPI002592E902|nr:hypothetical protein [uncultured Sphingomonas sp.]